MFSLAYTFLTMIPSRLLYPYGLNSYSYFIILIDTAGMMHDGQQHTTGDRPPWKWQVAGGPWTGWRG